MTQQLRPIGTEFELIFEPNKKSTSPHKEKGIYKIIAHEFVDNLDGGEPFLCEVVKCIKWEILDFKNKEVVTIYDEKRVRQ